MLNFKMPFKIPQKTKMLYKICTEFCAHNADGRNKRRSESMERRSVLMDWRTKHSQVVISFSNFVQFSFNFYKNLRTLFVETDKIILKFIWEDKASRMTKMILKKNRWEKSVYSFSKYVIHLQ